MFYNLPLEIKILIIEKSPIDLGKLLLVDREIYNYYISEQGQKWYNRISVTYVDTDKQKGMLRFNTFKDGEWQHYSKGNLVTSVIYNFGKMHGPQYTYYRKDLIKSITLYVNDIKHGEFISFHKNKNIMCKCTFFEGAIHGENIQYFKNNTIKSVENYVHGKLHGECRYKTPTQCFTCVYIYNNNVLVSNTEYAGELISRITTHNGKEMNVQSFTDGKLHTKFKRINGKLDGEYIQYHEKDIPYIEKIYDMGNVLSIKEYYKTAILRCETYYGEIGQKRTYYESGHIRCISNYQNTVLHGPYIEYYDNEQVKEEGSYIKGRKDGKWNYFFEDGKRDATKIYIENKMVEFLIYDNGEPYQRVWYRNDGSIIRFENHFDDIKFVTQRKFYY